MKEHEDGAVQRRSSPRLLGRGHDAGDRRDDPATVGGPARWSVTRLLSWQATVMGIALARVLVLGICSYL